MNIFEQYGIKEVADVCLYAIELDENDDEVYVPVLYLDTLKVSTVEETAEQTSARGGLGNTELVIWDFGKEMTVTLEDALYTPASMGMTWGGKYGTKKVKLNVVITKDGTSSVGKFIIDTYKDCTLTEGPALVYQWICNGSIIGVEGERYYIEKVVLAWNKTANGKNYWSIQGGRPVEINEQVSIEMPRELNIEMAPPQEAIYQIDHAINNVYYLDRIEKCKATQTFAINTDSNLTHSNCRYLEKYSKCELTVFIDPKTMQPYEPNTDVFVRKSGKEITGNLRVIKQHEIYYKWTRSKALDNTSLGKQIIVNATDFPGVYRLVGETYARSRKTGKDERFQFEIPKCKMGTENSFTFEAAGDPTTFNMTLKVLRPEDGEMIRLTQYEVEQKKYYDEKIAYTSDSTTIVPHDKIKEDTYWEKEESSDSLSLSVNPNEFNVGEQLTADNITLSYTGSIDYIEKIEDGAETGNIYSTEIINQSISPSDPDVSYTITKSN